MALALLVLTLPRPLVAPALVAPLAVLVAGVGAQVHVDAPVPMLVATLVLLGLGRVGVTVPSTPLWVAASWRGAFGLALRPGRRDWTAPSRTRRSPTSGATARSGRSWRPSRSPPRPRPSWAWAASPALVGVLRGRHSLGTFVVVLPPSTTPLTDATVSLLPCVLAWSVVATVAPERLRPAAVLPLAGAAVLPVAVFLDLAGCALRATLDVGAPFTQPFGVHVAESSPWVSPWLRGSDAGRAGRGRRAPWSACGRRCDVSTWVAVLGGAAIVGAVVTLPLYDVPLAAVVAVLLVASCAGFAVAERLPEPSATPRCGSSPRCPGCSPWSPPCPTT